MILFTGIRTATREDTMKQHLGIGLGMIAGVLIGAAGISVLHAQGKPKAYLVSESEVLDAAAVPSYTAAVTAVQKAAGARSLGTRGKIVAVIGDAPKRVGISEWDSLDQVQAYLNSAARKDLEPQRAKAIKITRQYIVEAGN
jgi:uncharacterized protein (DUF1330 family)